MAPDALHTDDLIVGREWSEASHAAAQWFDRGDAELCVEGVAVPRALRKWLANHPTGKPVDEIVVLAKAHAPLSQGQDRMAKSVLTVLAEIEPELVRRGVRIIRQGDLQ